MEIDVERRGDHLVVRWTGRRANGEGRFDRIEGAVPEWLGAADELLEGASRRDETAVVEALGSWADHAGLELGIWHDGGEVELLSRPRG